MILNYIYNRYAVYHDQQEKTYKIDGFNEVFASSKDANNFIKSLKVTSFLNDEVVGILYRLGYYRAAFFVQYEELVVKEKWSNGETELCFYYDSKKIDINGTIEPSDMLKIIEKLFSNSEVQKEEKQKVKEMVQGHLKTFIGSNQVIAKKDVDKVSTMITNGVLKYNVLKAI